jgi:hypothetical protein
VFFTLPEAEPALCNSFSYVLIHVETGEPLDPSLFEVRTDVAIPFVGFKLPARDPWLYEQPFYFLLKAEYGAYGHVESSNIPIGVYDTCFDTAIIPQSISQLTTFVNAPNPTTRVFEIFLDSVAAKHSE